MRFGELWILDYKPNAAKEDAAKVVTQLTLYANALAFRAKVPMAKLRCAYLDEQDWFEFRPEFLTRLRPAVAGAATR